MSGISPSLSKVGARGWDGARRTETGPRPHGFRPPDTSIRRPSLGQAPAVGALAPSRPSGLLGPQVTYGPPAGWPLPSPTASEQKERVPAAPTAYRPPPADGSRPLEELRASAEFRQSLLAFADDYDALGLPPEKAQALRDAVANGTVRLNPASTVEGLNFKTSRTYTPNAFGGYDTASSSSLKPVGKPKEAFDANRAMAMWYADYGSVYIEW